MRGKGVKGDAKGLSLSNRQDEVTTDEVEMVMQGADFGGGPTPFLGYDSPFATLTAALNHTCCRVVSSLTLDYELLESRMCLTASSPTASKRSATSVRSINQSINQSSMRALAEEDIGFKELERAFEMF